MPSQPKLPPQRFSIRRKVVLGFGFVLAMLGVITAITWKSTQAFQDAAKMVAQSREALELGEQVLRHLMEMESGRRGFLLTGDERYLVGYEDAQTELIQDFKALRRVTLESPEQGLRVERLKRLLTKSILLQNDEIEARRTQPTDTVVQKFAGTKTEQVTDQLRALLADFANFERATLAERSSLTRSIGRATNVVILIGTAITFMALASAGYLILRDIRARLRAEEALEHQANLLVNIIDAIPDHIFLKDVHGRFLLHNRAHRLYLGLRQHESIEGKTVFDFFPRDLAERYHADDLQVLEKGAPIRNREEPARPTAPNVEWLSTTKMPLREPGGRIVGIVCVSADITARKEADEQLKRFAAQLERSNAELQSFASVASHDLQEPLRKIQAFGDRLKAKCSDELGSQGLNYLERMQNAAERMQTLIQDLLKLSRVTSRARPFEPCDLGKVISEVLIDLEVAVERTGALVEVFELPTIDADPLQMRQLFQNLISNGLKFHQEGKPPHLWIMSEILTAPDPLLPGAVRGTKLCRIVVKDEGIGFEQKFAEQIFAVFQRLHTRQEFEGTGIGLAVCRKITDRHGGTIVAESAEGEGTAFFITLPVHQPEKHSHE